MTGLLKQLATNAINWDIGQHSALEFLLSIQRLSIKMLQCLLLAFSVPLSLGIIL